MNVPSGDRRPPLAVAMEWVSQITTVVAEMVLPGVAGQWLDQRWNTRFLALSGFALGLTVGIWHLIAMTKPRTGKPPIAGNGTNVSVETKETPDASSESRNGQN